MTRDDCEWRSARAFALGAVAAALALTILAFGIAGALRLAHHDNHRVCARGHDADPNPAETSPYFICDEWVPESPAPEGTTR